MGDEKKKVTCVLTITASGELLRPMIIFNKKEVLNFVSDDYLSNPVFCWSKNGWMDSDIMEVWFKKVVLPYVKGRRALIVFDSFRAHVSKKFQDLLLKYDKIDLEIIPGGLTFLLQPLDVIVNKGFKAMLRKNWALYLQKHKTKIFSLLSSQLESNQERVPIEVNYKRIEVEELKNCKLRKMLKNGQFTEVRKKRKSSNSNIPKITLTEIIDWIDQACILLAEEKVPEIVYGFKICGLSTAIDGSEDHLIHDFKYLSLKQQRL